MPASPAPRSLLVADSFRARVHDGVAEVRGFSLHLARFRASALATAREIAVGPPAAAPNRRVRSVSHSPLSERALDEFIANARAEIAANLEAQARRATHPDAVGGFPRLELWGSAESPLEQLELSFTLRPLPAIRSSIEMSRAEAPVGVSHPERKGPNIAAYAELARGLGCEGLLVDASGGAVEGTTTSLVWWDAAGRGFVSASARRVPSVAEALVARIARDLGAPLSPATVTPAQLASCAVWAVNALHGIRPVQGIDGLVPARHDPDRLAQYRAAFDGTWAPVRAR